MSSRKFRLAMKAVGAPASGAPFSNNIRADVLGAILHSACSKGDIHTCKAILSKMAAVSNNYNPSTLRLCLHNAVRSGQYDITELLLTHGVFVDQAILTCAISNGQMRIFSLLNGGEGDGASAVDWHIVYGPAIENGRGHVLNSLLQKRHSFPKILKEREERQSGQAVSFQGTPLMIAAKTGTQEVLQVLLDSELYLSKEHVNERAGPMSAAQTTQINTGVSYNHGWGYYPKGLRSWRNGDTPLFLAAARGDARFIVPLLRAGADPTLTNDEGDQPIHRLVRAFRDELLGSFNPRKSQRVSVMVGERFAAGLSALLKHSPALVDVRDQEGKTPLVVLVTSSLQAAGMTQVHRSRREKFEGHYAAAIVPLANELLSHGADPSVVDASGRTIEESVESCRVKKTYLKTVSAFYTKEEESFVEAIEQKVQPEVEKKITGKKRRQQLEPATNQKAGSSEQCIKKKRQQQSATQTKGFIPAACTDLDEDSDWVAGYTDDEKTPGKKRVAEKSRRRVRRKLKKGTLACSG